VSTRFRGQTAIVTGGSRGIGFAIAARLVADGARVVITARGTEALDEAVAALGGPEHALGVSGKADDVEHQAATVQVAIETFGSADFLVNNTGINPAYGAMVDLDLSVARKVVEINVFAALAWTQEVCRAWMKDHGGAVVNVASVSGVRPAPGIGMYGASKAMLISMTELLALELAPDIRVNAVAPAVVKTKFATALYEGREDDLAAGYPLGRLGEPDDVGGAVAFLLASDSSWVTGQTVVVDGGVTLAGSAT
jgi:NAD(P)-dependent dehydrogenase (short-subunit alcohol dehydrogenase family)